MTRQRLLVAVFWVAVSFTFVMAILPHPPTLPGEPSDKVQHIVAFVVLTVLGGLAYPRARTLAVLAALSAFGALIEVVQAIPALHRDSDWRDWLADTAAILAALAVVWLVRRFGTPTQATDRDRG